MVGLSAGFVTKPHGFVHGRCFPWRFLRNACTSFVNRGKTFDADSSVRLSIEDGLGFEILLDKLPPLPARTWAYYTEPGYGVLLVVCLSATLLSAVRGLASLESLDGYSTVAAAHALTWCFACAALTCTAFVVFGQSGEIRRSRATCYPIPEEVRALLLAARPAEKLGQNVARPDGSSYCVRCLVWRPAKTAAHHCSACNRCVVGFDHHCSTFGRCIVEGNMPCFVALYAMLTAGFAMMIFCFAMYAFAPDAPSMVIHTMDVMPLR